MTKAITSVVADDCQKIINTILQCKNREFIKQQLTAVRQATGKWIIKTNIIIPSAETNSCIIQYQLHSEELGDFVTIAILKYNDKGLVELIDEVFHQI